MSIGESIMKSETLIEGCGRVSARVQKARAKIKRLLRWGWRFPQAGPAGRGGAAAAFDGELRSPVTPAPYISANLGHWLHTHSVHQHLSINMIVLTVSSVKRVKKWSESDQCVQLRCESVWKSVWHWKFWVLDMVLCDYPNVLFVNELKNATMQMLKVLKWPLLSQCI